MDELEKKAQEGLDRYRAQSGDHDISSLLDKKIDKLIGDSIDDPPKGISKIPKGKWMLFVLGLLGVCLMGYLGYRDGQEQKVKKVNHHELFAAHFEVLPSTKNLIQRGDLDSVTGGDNGFQSYAAGDFENAYKLLIGNTESAEDVVYAGISALKTQEYDKAISALEKAKSLVGAAHVDDVRLWYLSLAYLGEGKIEETRQVLEKIAAARGHYKAEEAQIMLRKL